MLYTSEYYHNSLLVALHFWVLLLLITGLSTLLSIIMTLYWLLYTSKHYISLSWLLYFSEYYNYSSYYFSLDALLFRVSLLLFTGCSTLLSIIMTLYWLLYTSEYCSILVALCLCVLLFTGCSTLLRILLYHIGFSTS